MQHRKGKYFEFVLTKGNLKRLLFFKSLSKAGKNAMYADYGGKSANTIRAQEDDVLKKISLNNYTPIKHNGGQAYLRIESESYIVYNKKTKKVFTLSPEKILQALIHNPRIQKALKIECFLSITEASYAKLQIPKSIVDTTKLDIYQDFDIKYHEPYGLKHTFSAVQSTVRDLDGKIFGNKLVIKAIMTGRCTSKDNAYRRYYKSRFGLNLGYRDATILASIYGSFNLGDFLVTTTNLPNLIKFTKSTWINLDKDQRRMLSDYLEMALTVRAKINYAWSYKRMVQEHDKITKELIMERCKYKSLKEVTYEVQPPEIDGLEYMTSSMDLVMESGMMRHCIGTSDYYGDNMVSFRSVLARYNKDGVRGTIQFGIYSRKDSRLKVNVSQFMMSGNRTPPQEAREIARTMAEVLAESPFFEYLVEAQEEFDKSEDKKLDSFVMEMVADQEEVDQWF